METGFDSQTEVKVGTTRNVVLNEESRKSHRKMSKLVQVAKSIIVGGYSRPTCYLRWKDKPECRSKIEGKPLLYP